MNSKTIASLLKEGTIVNTRVGSNNIWYQSIVCSSTKGGDIELPLLYSYLENLIMPGTNIKVKYTLEHFEYLFEGTITEIKPSAVGYITVHLGKGEEIINTRAFPRYDVYLAASIKPQWENSTVFSVITNIGLGGAAFLSTYKFEYGEEIELEIFLPIQGIFKGRGKIIRRSIKNNIIDYSLQFIEGDEANEKILSEHINWAEDEKLKLRKQYCCERNIDRK